MVNLHHYCNMLKLRPSQGAIPADFFHQRINAQLAPLFRLAHGTVMIAKAVARCAQEYARLARSMAIAHRE
jgi:hypothetical protein